MEEIVYILQASLVPIVILSSADLLSLSLQQRYGRVIDRIRYFHERIYEGKRVEIIEEQIEILIKRGKLLRNSMFFIMLCIIFALLTTIFLSHNIISGENFLITIIFFFLSLFVLLVSVLFAIMEIFISYNAVLRENEKIRKVRH